jgi:hypothetical protein
MKDQRVRYRPAERATVMSAGVQAFCLVNGNLRAATMAELFIDALTDMVAACRTPGPFLYSVSSSGICRTDL